MRGNRKGPEDKGPKTGRGLGLCSGYDKPGYLNTFVNQDESVFGRGLGRGMGRGRGRGMARGFGQGRAQGCGVGRGLGRGLGQNINSSKGEE